HPFQTFSGGFHLSEVIVASALGADDGRDHGGYVYELAAGDGADPAGGSAVNMGVTYGGTAGTYADEGSVPAASEDRRSWREPQLGGSLFRQRPSLIGGGDDVRQMLCTDVEGPAEALAPRLLPGVIKQGGEGGILGHHKTAGAAVDEILLHIQPFIGPRKIFRLVGFDPLIFPHGKYKWIEATSRKIFLG